MSVYTTETLPTGRLDRFSSGVQHIDWLLGSEIDGYGFARGALSLWGGEAGVGKTRALIEICDAFTKMNGRVLWFQNEQQLSLFKAKYLLGRDLGKNFLFSDVSDCKKMCELIKKVAPDLVVVDSINKIDQYRNSEGVIKALEGMFREAINALEIPAHMALITQLNAEGDIKGGTTLPHMVDTVLHIQWSLRPLFTISIPDKNRFGLAGEDSWVGCNHRSDGVLFEQRGDNWLTSKERLDGGACPDDKYIIAERPGWHYMMLPFALAMTIFGYLIGFLLLLCGSDEAGVRNLGNFKMWWGIFCLDLKSWKMGFGIMPEEPSDSDF